MATYTQSAGSATFDGDINTINATAAGIRLGTGHPMAGGTISSITAYFKRNNTNTTSQTYRCRILNSDETQKALSSDSYDRADLSNTTYSAKAFAFSPAVSINANDWIEFYSDTTSNGDFILLHFNDDDTHSGNYGHRNYAGTRSNYYTSDLIYTAQYEASSGGGSGGGSGEEEGATPIGDGLPQTERLQILSTVVPR